MPDRELGGYVTSVAMGGGGPSIREIAIILSPAAGTAEQNIEQTFTVPGLLANDRIAYCQPTTGAVSAGGTSAGITIGVARVSAISVAAIPFINTCTSAAGPTGSMTYVFGVASARVIP
ncbi:MAG: hypothetical protein HY323_08110 [Betaproteobacteria bacterium]|nr:hypothetical protein [Betaproteobacteria bacterium]